jgi:hypothetical protein
MFIAILPVLSDAADKKQRHIPSNRYTAVSPEPTPNNATTEPLRRSMKVSLLGTSNSSERPLISD